MYTAMQEHGFPLYYSNYDVFDIDSSKACCDDSTRFYWSGIGDYNLLPYLFAETSRLSEAFTRIPNLLGNKKDDTLPLEIKTIKALHTLFSLSKLSSI